jgi:hypothetical protein
MTPTSRVRPTGEQQARRRALWLCAVGLALSYVLVFAEKALELAPTALTWTVAAVAPLALFGLLAGGAASVSGPFGQDGGEMIRVG